MTEQQITPRYASAGVVAKALDALNAAIKASEEECGWFIKPVPGSHPIRLAYYRLEMVSGAIGANESVRP